MRAFGTRAGLEHFWRIPNVQKKSRLNARSDAQHYVTSFTVKCRLKKKLLISISIHLLTSIYLCLYVNLNFLYISGDTSGCWIPRVAVALAARHALLHCAVARSPRGSTTATTKRQPEPQGLGPRSHNGSIRERGKQKKETEDERGWRKQQEEGLSPRSTQEETSKGRA